MINITINGRKINVINHSTILQACKSNGINIPKLSTPKIIANTVKIMYGIK